MRCRGGFEVDDISTPWNGPWLFQVSACFGVKVPSALRRTSEYDTRGGKFKLSVQT